MKLEDWSDFEVWTLKFSLIGWAIMIIGSMIVENFNTLESIGHTIAFGGLFLMMFSFLYWFTAYFNRKEILFVKHIKRHLEKDHKVICKICDKDIDTIFKEERWGIK